MAFKAGAIIAEAKLDDSNFKKGAQGVSDFAGKAGKAILGVAAAAGATLTAALIKSTVEADAFQKQMANVNTIVDNTQVNTQKLALDILKLDPALGNATEITAGFYQAFSAGAPTAEAAMDIVVESAKFAKAAVTDTATAVDILTTAVNAYGAEEMSAQKASDLFFTTIKQGKIDGEQLSAVIGQSIPLFASAGIEMEELSAGIAAMTKQGVSASESTTQLNGIVNAFLKPTADLTALLEEQGYASGAALLESEGLAGALKILEDATAGDAAELGKLLPNIRAMTGAMALTGTGGQEFANILDEMSNSAGASSAAFAEQEITFDTLKNSLSNAQVVVGNLAKHFADDLAGGATEATQAFIAFVMSTQGAELAGKIVGGLAGTFEVLKTSLVFIKDNVLDTFADQWGDITEALDELKGESGETFTALDFLGGVLQFVSSALKITGVAIGGVIENVINFVTVIKNAGGTVGTFFDMLKGEASWQDVKTQAALTGEAMKTFATDAVGNIKDLVVTVSDEVTSFGANAEAATVKLQSAWSDTYTSVSSNVKESYIEMLTGQADYEQAAMDQAATFADDMKGQLEDKEDERAAAVATINEERLEAARAFYELFKEEEAVNYEAQIEQATEFYEEGLLTYEEYQESLATIRRNADEAEANETDAHLKEMVGKIQQYASSITSIMTTAMSAISTALDAYYRNEMLAAEQTVGDINNLTDQEKARLNGIAREQFESQKSLRTAELWINFAAGTVGVWANAFSTYEPITAAVLAGVMTALLAAEASAQQYAISSEQFVAPYAKGGTTGDTPYQMINEQGPEIVQLPDGTIIVPNELSESIAQGAGAPTIHIVINSPVVDDERRLRSLTDRISRELARRI